MTSDLLLNIHIQPQSWFPGIFAYFAGNNLEKFKIHAHGFQICQEILETGWEWVGFCRPGCPSPHTMAWSHQLNTRRQKVTRYSWWTLSKFQVNISDWVYREWVCPPQSSLWAELELSASVHWFVSDPAWHCEALAGTSGSPVSPGSTCRSGHSVGIRHAQS